MLGLKVSIRKTQSLTNDFSLHFASFSISLDKTGKTFRDNLEFLRVL